MTTPVQYAARGTELQKTLGNPAWMNAHAGEIEDIFPETWTHVKNLDGPVIGSKLKSLGIDWSDQEELGMCMMVFELSGIIKRDGFLVKKGSSRILIS